jgi:ribosomal-protein-alanine N-acetyltransferase
MHISLSACSTADFETLYAIDQSCYPRGIAYSRSTLREFLSLPGADCLLARVGPSKDAPIGGFIIGETDGNYAHIITIDILEAHRRTGIGTALLQALEDRMAARGVRQVELETATQNAVGVAFWQHHGYRKMGILRNYYLGRFDAWEMRKTLRAEPPEKAH